MTVSENENENEMTNDEEAGMEEVEYRFGGISPSFLIKFAEGCRDWGIALGFALAVLSIVMFGDEVVPGSVSAALAGFGMFSCAIAVGCQKIKDELDRVFNF